MLLDCEVLSQEALSFRTGGAGRGLVTGVWAQRVGQLSFLSCLASEPLCSVWTLHYYVNLGGRLGLVCTGKVELSEVSSALPCMAASRGHAP